MAQREREAAELLRQYLATKKVLIVDANAAARSSLFSVVRELGALTQNLSPATTYAQAQAKLNEFKPHIVIAEFDLGRNCGLELFRSQREQYPQETKDCIFIIVTGNTSQSAAARALEEDVDAYIIKPYTLEFVRKTVVSAIVRKIKPPPYYAAIEAGKNAMAVQKYDQAEKHFTEALALEESPSLAYYYLGYLKYVREILNQAHDSYSKGLKVNRIHYKCLVGTYELFMKENRLEEAYESIRRIAKYFPANPQRLAEVLRLAITIGKYEDIEKYYKLFEGLDERSETLIKYITAALVVAGRSYLSNNIGNARVVELFEKAAIVSKNNPKIIAEIIPLFIEHKMLNEAKKIFSRFQPEAMNKDEYALSKFFILSGEHSPSIVIMEGRKLITQGIESFRLYQIMIEKSLHNGLMDVAEDYFYTTVQKYPDKKEELKKKFPGLKVK